MVRVLACAPRCLGFDSRSRAHSLGCEFDSQSQLGSMWEATSQCVFLTHMFLSLSLSPPSSLELSLKISGENPWVRIKETHKNTTRQITVSLTTQRQQLVANQSFHSVLYYTQFFDQCFLGIQTQFMLLRHWNNFVFGCLSCMVFRSCHISLLNFIILKICVIENSKKTEC